MRRVPPSVLIRQELDGLPADGVDSGENLISELVQTVSRLVILQLLEAGRRDVLGDRGRYQRRDPDAGQRGGCNGYVESSIRTAEGKIPIRVPQVRDAGGPFRYTLIGFLEGNSEVLDHLVMEMYDRGHVDSRRRGRLP